MEFGQTPNQKILIPSNDLSLRLRIVIVAHCGEHNGHVGKTETLKTIRQVFTWQRLEDDVGKICGECLHCYPVRGGHRVPRPLGEQVHGTRVGQVLHTDVLYVEDEAKADSTVNTKFNCIIVLYCDFSGLTWLVPCLDANAEDIASVLASWRSRYKTPEIIVSDQASYFKSQFVKAYLQKTGTKQHCVVSYSHFPNGTVEIVNRHVLSLLRALISELRWDKQDWPYLVESVEHTLNHRRQGSRMNKAAVEFIGVEPDSPLDYIVKQPVKGVVEAQPTSEDIQRHCDNLAESLKNMHKSVAKSLERSREKARLDRQKHMPKGTKLPNFELGEYVLVAMTDTAQKSTAKLKRRWQGPYRVYSLESDWVVVVEDLISKKKEAVHITRLRFYCDKYLHVSTELVRQYAFDCEKWVVDKLKRIRWPEQNNDIEILVSWKGFEEAEDSWEPMARLAHDVPVLCAKFVSEGTELHEQYQTLLRQYKAKP